MMEDGEEVVVVVVVQVSSVADCEVMKGGDEGRW
jgi:hypothetical protein